MQSTIEMGHFSGIFLGSFLGFFEGFKPDLQGLLFDSKSKNPNSTLILEFKLQIIY
jgi:hypothetical protein